MQIYITIVPLIILIIVILIIILIAIITLGMPIQLPEPSDATEHGESGTPELFRSGVLQIAIGMLGRMMVVVVMMMIVMTKPSLIIIRGVGQTWSHDACVAPTSRFRVVFRDEPS